MVIPNLNGKSKIVIGDQGIFATGEMVKFRDFQAPVVFTGSTPIGASIIVVGFAKDRLQVKQHRRA